MTSRVSVKKNVRDLSSSLNGLLRENQHGADLKTMAALLHDPPAAAEVAGLHYVSDQTPGITRRRSGRGFAYLQPHGSAVQDTPTLARIKALAIPPAWKKVWICPDPLGHLQASGRDDRGRKQFLYHARWSEVRDANKFAHILEFARALPVIRRRTAEHLALPGLPREKILAALVRLLDKSLIRIGNEEYSRQNNSYGLTTLRTEHVEVKGTTIKFQFRGKSGKFHDIDVSDRRLARLVKRLQDLPGQELFVYLGDDGEPHSVSSQDVNQYLRAITGKDITAKDFRTWSATVLATVALCECCGKEAPPLKQHVTSTIKTVAERLGNTPAVCRASYIHPVVLEAYIEGALTGLKMTAEAEEPEDGLSQPERRVLNFLRRRLETGSGQPVV